MKKNIIESTIILLIGGLLVKVLSMIIKIIMTRNIGIETLSLYTLILPTFSLFINISQIGLPIALSRLVALNNKNNKKLYLSVIPITMVINIIISSIIMISSKYISIHLLHNNNIDLAIKAIALVIPFTTLSSICRSYFFGKEKMFPHITSLITENIIRLLFMIFILPKIIYIKVSYLLLILVLSNIISELVSTIILIVFIPKNTSININDFKPKYSYIKEAYKLGIPNVGSSIIYSLTYFLEPILLTNILLSNYSNKYIITEYGIINGYVIPLILLPNFFTIALSQAIMPYITKRYKENKNKEIVKIIVIISSIITIFSIIIILSFFIYGKTILKIIYKTSLGYNYLKILCPFFIFQYLQSIFLSTLNALGKTKDILYISLISSTIRIISIIIFSHLKIGIYSYIISIIINIILTTIYQLKIISKYIKKNDH